MTERICSIGDCDRRAYARGWCTMHWQRWQRHGDPTVVLSHPGPRTDPVERFWSKVDQSDPDGCWPWTGARDDEGYGQFKVDRRSWRAQRYMFNLVNPDEPILDDEMVRHACDNPPCVNPAHLDRGDAAANIADQVERDRLPRGDRHRLRRDPSAALRGSANGSARLTEDQVRDIRARYAAGEKQVPLAAEYGVSQITVSLIVRRKTWTHLKE